MPVNRYPGKTLGDHISVSRETITSTSQYIELAYAILVPGTIIVALFWGTLRLFNA